jgi:iron(III) transport system substrate-binding protein
MAQEGEASEADLFLTVDGGVLEYAKLQGVLQPFVSEEINRNVPPQWRDPDEEWVGIATRARVIVYAKDRVQPEELSSYEDLGAEKWKGRIVARSASNLYNQSLLASLIAINGEEEAKRWAKGIVRNFARQPDGGDRAQAKAVANGMADVAIMNTYYIGQMSASGDPEEARMADRLGIVFPNQDTTGTHVNISGIGLARHAPNKDGAIELIKYLTGKEGQTLLTQGSYEFPVNREADLPELLQRWGTFKAQQYDFASLERYGRKARELFAEAGWE